MKARIDRLIDGERINRYAAHKLCSGELRFMKEALTSAEEFIISGTGSMFRFLHRLLTADAEMSGVTILRLEIYRFMHRITSEYIYFHSSLLKLNSRYAVHPHNKRHKSVDQHKIDIPCKPT
ncbi:hypothetical protein EG68_01221 [Paragonimus skrjabini miyazakii]|uniref:Uncharacterized protein n=1 Tax=Paragonimus skrjabini miyazakii TaxID=59628 RepID=A0A8S9ZA32_9TREM|nr:hypothetical protein EG68_01221 [Paragonimus skrjabini miyazakii]